MERKKGKNGENGVEADTSMMLCWKALWRLTSGALSTSSEVERLVPSSHPTAGGERRRISMCVITMLFTLSPHSTNKSWPDYRSLAMRGWQGSASRVCGKAQNPPMNSQILGKKTTGCLLQIKGEQKEHFWFSPSERSETMWLGDQRSEEDAAAGTALRFRCEMFP